VSNANRVSLAILRSPVVWGLLATLGFYTVLHSGSLEKLPHVAPWVGMVMRYTAGHPIEYVEVTMFLIGLSALVIKAFDITAQLRLLPDPLLGAPPAAGGPGEDPQTLLGRLDAFSDAVKETYLHQRVKGAVDHVAQAGSADTLDDHVKYLSDMDAGKAHSSFGFVRLLVWAIPIMGFLGTVVGITGAIGNLASGDVIESLPQVTSGLGVAFDTTALALVCATVLMFGQFRVDRREGMLLDGVEARTQQELAGRFERFGGGSDPQVAAIRRMADALVKSTERVVERQAELWQQTIDVAHGRWGELTSTSQKQMETALSSALEHSLLAHARHIETAGRMTTQQNLENWAGVQQSLERGTAALVEQQRELTRQGQVLLQVVEATGQVTKLEEALNRNLASLAGSHNFDEAVQSLAAVIHLLTARLGQQPLAATTLGRGETRGVGQAA
jgi:hypothetical protein